MSPTVTLKGKMGFKLARLITGGEMVSSEYSGPGQILIAPPFLGDITPIKLFSANKTEEEKIQWNVGKDAFIACTAKVKKDVIRQSISKAIFSGEALWVYGIKGNGILWISSFGAIVKRDVSHAPIMSVTQSHNCDSLGRVRNSSSTTVISWHGIVNMSWSVSLVEAISRACLRAKAWSVSSRVRGRCTFKHAIRLRLPRT